MTKKKKIPDRSDAEDRRASEGKKSDIWLGEINTLCDLFKFNMTTMLVEDLVALHPVLQILAYGQLCLSDSAHQKTQKYRQI